MEKINNEGLFKAEAKIQQECVQWYKNTFCLKHHVPRCMLFSIPNEGRGAASMQLMATGLYPGCADLLIFHQVWYGKPNESMRISVPHFFEVKSPDNKSGPLKNGQSQKQIDFEDHCKAMGIPYHIVTSKEQFKQVIEKL